MRTKNNVKINGVRDNNNNNHVVDQVNANVGLNSLIKYENLPVMMVQRRGGMHL